MLRRSGWCVLVAMMGLLIAPATRGVEAKSRRQRSRPFAMRAHAVDFEKKTHWSRRSRERSFEGYATHSIEFDVFRRGRSEMERPTQVKLYLPNGDLYMAVDLEPFESDSNAGRRSRAPAATGRLRVSGSAITRYGLYGDWRADVCWEMGSEASCQPGLRFEIH